MEHNFTMTLPLQPKKQQAKSPKPQKSAKTEVSVEPAQPFEDNEGIASIVYITMATTIVVSVKQTKIEIVCTSALFSGQVFCVELVLR